MTDDAAPPPPADAPAPGSSPCLAGERVAFTGTLASMTHRDAARLVEQNGGTATAHVSQQTTMLVVGEEGWPLEPNGTPSQKLLQAAALLAHEAPLRVLNESEWLHLLGIADRSRDVHRLYTPAGLSQLLGVPVNVIRGWERLGLIRAVRKVHRLPYFDFQEVTGARRLCELFEAGVPASAIQAGLDQLRAMLPGVERPLAQLQILAHDRRIVYRDAHGYVDPQHRQRLFEFPDESAASPEPQADGESATLAFPAPAPCPEAPQDALAEAAARAAVDDLAGAEQACRRALRERPGDPEVNFHLAEILYRQGHVSGAAERYHAVVEFDPLYLEAWTQLGCVCAQLGESSQALAAFDQALALYPDYAEAHLHKAELLKQLDRTPEAVEHWRRYLDADSRGPWADSARQQLAEAGCGEEPD